MTTRRKKENKEKFVSQIFDIEDEQLNPSKYLRANIKKHVSDPSKKPIRVLEKRHVSAPAKISTRAPSKLNITKLPNDLKKLIVNKYVNMLPDRYKLRDWIPEEKINWRDLCKNPNAIDMIEERIIHDSTLTKKEFKDRYQYNAQGYDIYKTIYWPSLSNNKNAIELIKNKIIAEDSLTLQEYEKLDWSNRLDWTSIAVNKDYKAMELLNMKRSKINWNLLSINKNAMELFILPKYNEEKLIDPEILFNIMHSENKKLDWSQLSKNEGAIKIIKEHLLFEDTIPLEIYNDLDSSNKIDWGGLATNPNAMPIIIKFIEKYIQYEDIDDEEHPYYRYAQHFDDIWRNLSKNPKAAKYLYENYPEKINWRAFSGNPKAIRYLNEPINYDKINWQKLSKNPAAINLLKENIGRIDWYYISCNTNPEAMELIRVKFEQEKYDTENNTLHLHNLRTHEKLDWNELSQNPAIFEEIFT